MKKKILFVKNGAAVVCRIQVWLLLFPFLSFYILFIAICFSEVMVEVSMPVLRKSMKYYFISFELATMFW